MAKQINFGLVTSDSEVATPPTGYVAFYFKEVLGVHVAYTKDSSGTVEPIGAGGGSTILTATEPIIQGSWSGNTNYQYNVTVAGAAVGDVCIFSPDEDVMANLNSANASWYGYAYCSSANTVTAICRISSYITIPTSSILTVKVIK